MQDKKKITDNKILKNEITLLKIQITWGYLDTPYHLYSGITDKSQSIKSFFGYFCSQLSLRRQGKEKLRFADTVLVGKVNIFKNVIHRYNIASQYFNVSTAVSVNSLTSFHHCLSKTNTKIIAIIQFLLLIQFQLNFQKW